VYIIARCSSLNTTTFSFIFSPFPHDSVLICGLSHYDWTGYAFGNTGTERDTFEDELTFDSYDHIDEREEEREELPMFSDGPFTCGSTDQPSECEPMTWDPRTYLLRCLKIRVDVSCREWTYLIQHFNSGAMKWVSGSYILYGG
jgi:hypothetical protein